MSIEFVIFILALAALVITRNREKFSKITTVAGSTIAGMGGVGEGVRKYLKWILLVGVTLLLIVLTLPIEKNHGVLLPLVVAFMVIVLLTMIWPETFKSTVMRWVIYIYALVVIDMSLMSLFPVFMMKYAHFNPDWLKTTLSESETYKFHEVEREKADKSRAQKIAQLTERIKRGENLSEAEKQIIREEDAKMGMIRPEKPSGVAQSVTGTQETLPEKIVTTPFTVYGNGNWSVTNVPAGYTFTYTCSGWGLVKIYGNNIKPKKCGPRNSTPEDWFGDNLRTENGPDGKQRLRVAFTSTSQGPITAQVTMTKNH